MVSTELEKLYDAFKEKYNLTESDYESGYVFVICAYEPGGCAPVMITNKSLRHAFVQAIYIAEHTKCYPELTGITIFKANERIRWYNNNSMSVLPYQYKLNN